MMQTLPINLFGAPAVSGQNKPPDGASPGLMDSLLAKEMTGPGSIVQESVTEAGWLMAAAIFETPEGINPDQTAEQFEISAEIALTQSADNIFLFPETQAKTNLFNGSEGEMLTANNQPEQSGLKQLWPQTSGFSSESTGSADLSKVLQAANEDDSVSITIPRDSISEGEIPSSQVVRKPVPKTVADLMELVSGNNIEKVKATLEILDPRLVEKMQSQDLLAVQQNTDTLKSVSETMDPRFHGLLEKVSRIKSSLAEGVQVRENDLTGSTSVQSQSIQPTNDANQEKTDFLFGENTRQNIFSGKSSDTPSPADAMKTVGEGFGTTLGQFQNTAQALTSDKYETFAKLPSGNIVAESQVVRQVVEQLHVSPRNESSSITIRMQPEELGHLKVDLVIIKEHVTAHLQAQNHQAQDILERHIHRLRESLEQQGLKLDDIQVSVSSDRDGGRALFQDRESFPFTGHDNQHSRNWRADTAPEDSPVLVQRESEGLSLRI